MMLRLVTVALLLAVGGGNAKRLRGTRGVNREHPDHELLRVRKLMMSGGKSKATGGVGEPSVPATTKAPDAGIRDDPVPATTKAPVSGGNPQTGACLCDALCIACNKQGIQSADCKAACSFVGNTNCNELCNALLTGVGGGDIRDDPIAQPPTVPPVPATTKAPVTGGNTGTCRCDAICLGCIEHGIQTNDCNTVCSFVKDSNCNQLCNDFLADGGGDIRDDPEILPPLPPAGPPVCQCVALCKHCEDSGSHTAPCKTVCEYAKQETSVCITNCNAVLHVGEPDP